MSIAYPITLPSSPGPATVEWSPFAAVARFASPFTLQQQIQVHQGQLWAVKFSLPSLSEVQGETWIAALLSLNGSAGVFLFGDSVRTTPRGSGGGTPVINGANQSGQTLLTRGWPNNITGVLLKGDWLQIGSGLTQRIYRVLGDVNSSPTGQATIDIWPRLREAPADGAAIVVSQTKGVFRLKENIMDWSIDNAKRYGIAIEAIEALGVVQPTPVIPAPPSGTGAFWSETPSGSINGVNTVFTLNFNPNINSLLVFAHGVALRRVPAFPQEMEYTISGTTLTLGMAPAPGIPFFCSYVLG